MSEKWDKISSIAELGNVYDIAGKAGCFYGVLSKLLGEADIKNRIHEQILLFGDDPEKNKYAQFLCDGDETIDTLPSLELHNRWNETIYKVENMNKPNNLIIHALADRYDININLHSVYGDALVPSASH